MTTSKSNGGEERTRPSQIAHFGLRTSPENYEKMIKWHLNFHGGSEALHYPDASFIRYDDEHHRYNILADSTYTPIANRRLTQGIYHISFSLPTLAALADSYEEKKARAIIPHWPVNHGMSTSMYYYDPDGNEFEMQVDNFDTAEEAHAFMRTAEFEENPIGVDIDLPAWLERVRSGEDEKVLKKRPVIGRRLSRWENSIYYKLKDKYNPPATTAVNARA